MHITPVTVSLILITTLLVTLAKSVKTSDKVFAIRKASRLLNFEKGWHSLAKDIASIG